MTIQKIPAVPVRAGGLLLIESARELAFTPVLDLTVADGANAGTYKARTVAALKWRAIIGGEAYVLCPGPDNRLAMKGPLSSVSATSVAGEPFSATFPGAIVGAKNDIVVTLACP